MVDNKGYSAELDTFRLPWKRTICPGQVGAAALRFCRSCDRLSLTLSLSMKLSRCGSPAAGPTVVRPRVRNWSNSVSVSWTHTKTNIPKIDFVFVEAILFHVHH
eukprot:jgi/Botrbrau1/10142/Bobra.0191s0013.1